MVPLYLMAAALHHLARASPMPVLVRIRPWVSASADCVRSQPRREAASRREGLAAQGRLSVNTETRAAGINIRSHRATSGELKTIAAILEAPVIEGLFMHLACDELQSASQGADLNAVRIG